MASGTGEAAGNWLLPQRREVELHVIMCWFISLAVPASACGVKQRSSKAASSATTAGGKPASAEPEKRNTETAIHWL